MEKLDPWELALVDRYRIEGFTNDWDAWISYAEHRWVYDKYKLSRKLNKNLYAGFKVPFGFRSIIRPRFNFDGLGRGVEILDGLGRDKPRVPFGYFVQEFIKGRHYSVDKRPDGSLVCYVGLKINAKQFYLWVKTEKIPFRAKLDELEPIWAVDFANIEAIGDTIIECHLRPSIQTYSEPNFSLVIHGGNERGRIPDVKPDTIHDMILIDDPEDTRRLIVNGDDLRTCYEMANIIMGY